MSIVEVAYFILETKCICREDYILFWQFILLTKHISSHIPSQSVDKCMLSNTLFPAFDEKHTFLRFPSFSMGER